MTIRENIGLLVKGAVLWLAVALPVPSQVAPTMIPTPVVSTRSGQVQGIVVNGVSRFLGIRYAAPPVGALRFKPAQDPEPWKGIDVALGYGAPCMQAASEDWLQPNNDIPFALLAVLGTNEDVKINNEDCLYLNVWTPAVDAAKRPVMVWIHGGAFSFGAGSEPLYDGTNLARRGDVVVVTLNHRLNAFGYMDLSGIGGPAYADSVNLGQLDLVKGLQWVHDNIAAFGGDPSNVTIMGESGGALKVSYLLGMPAAKDLFQKAIIQSGPGIQGRNEEAVKQRSVAILKAAGMKEFSQQWLETVRPEKLVKAYLGATVDEEIAVWLRPVTDGKTLPRDPFSPDASPLADAVPLLIGWNKDELNLMTGLSGDLSKPVTDEQLRERAAKMYCGKGLQVLAELRKIHPDYSPAYLMTAMGTAMTSLNTVTLAERKAAQHAPVYVYEFTWETPILNGLFKTPHFLDVPFMFDNIAAAEAWVGSGADQQKLAGQMSDAWIAFARSGNPNTPGRPFWPRYDSQRHATMLLNVQSHVEDNPYGTVHALLKDRITDEVKPQDCTTNHN
jgi:para-nitrobenzyl esterase